jgi:hypothetical protein
LASCNLFLAYAKCTELECLIQSKELVIVPIVVEPFSDKHPSAVRDFNKRISDGRISYRFPESPVPRWLPRRDSIPLYQEFFIASEGNMVRGGYMLKYQPFACSGEVSMIADYQLPISEGTADSRYALVGLMMLKDALKREPFLFALGMGGYQESLPRMLKVMKWSMISCPFFFKVIHPLRFLREIVFLRKKRFMGILLDFLAFSGLGWLLIKSMQSVRQLGQWVEAGIRMQEVDSFSCWSDEIWKQVKDRYTFIGVRDATILNTLYPVADRRFRRIKVLRRDKAIGWAVVLNTKMKNNNYFGNMSVGTVVDCLAEEGEERHVVTMATQYLERLGVDMIVTNQSHHSWCKAFARSGYLAGPSNYIFAVSPPLANKLHPFDIAVSKAHLTRGDGDGPSHLLAED